MIFPNFLILLPIIAIPIIIHLLGRKKLKRIDFPTLLFIIKSEVKLIRWIQLKNLLLLFLRIIILVFIILSAGGVKIPFSIFGPGEIFLIDKSPSMERFTSPKKNSIIIPTNLGIPLFQEYFKKYPFGVLITDAQRNGFTKILQERTKYPGIKIKKIPLPEGNLGIIEAKTGASFEEEETPIFFKILNEYKDERKTKVLLKLDGKLIKEEHKFLKRGENEFLLTFSTKRGLHELVLEIEDEEGLKFDNKYYLALRTQSKKKISIVSLNYPERLIAALSFPYFETKWIKKTSEIKEDFFIASSYSEEDLSSLLLNPTPGIISLSGEKNTVISNKIPWRISTIAETPFGEIPKIKFLDEIPIKYNCFIKAGEPLFYFKNGDPFITKLKNHLILPFSLEENDLSLHPVFIPFLFNLIGSLSDEVFYKNIFLDEPILIKSSFPLEIVTPDGKRYRMLQKSENIYIFKETKICGIYKLSDGFMTKGLIAVNTHPSESKIETLKDEEIKSIFGISNLTNGSFLFLVFALLCFILTLFVEKRD
ncbi:MAG: BatA domain-containing protein [candidate division WOR-3 bacterium]